MKRWILTTLLACSTTLFSITENEVVAVMKEDNSSNLKQMLQEEINLPEGKELLHYVVEYKALKCGDMLLADPNLEVKPFEMGANMMVVKTPFMSAVESKDLEVVKLFLDSGKIDAQTAFCMSIGNLDLEGLKHIFAQYDVDLASFKFGEKEVMLPITGALLGEEYEVFDYLLSKMTKQDLAKYPENGPWKGKTIYHVMAMMPPQMAFSRIQYLLKSGVDPLMVDDQGKAVKQCCSDSQLLNLLDNHDAEYKDEGFGPHIEKVDEQELDQLTNSYKKPLVVDFYAEWCPPCQRMKPIMIEMSQKYLGKVKFVALDVDRSKDLRSKYDLKGVPSFRFYDKGELVKAQFGSTSKEVFQEMIETEFELN